MRNILIKTLPGILFLLLSNISFATPVPQNDSITICENTGPTKVPVEGIDSTLDSPPVIISGPNHGTASLSGKSIVYTPNHNFSGKDTITYVVCTILPVLCDTDHLYITVNPGPVANAGTNQIMCYGDTIRIGDSTVAGDTYQWTPNSGLSSYTIADPKASPADTTEYYLTVTKTSDGCSARDSVLITVKPVPSAYIVEGDTAYFCHGQPMTLTASNGVSFSWSNGDTTKTIVVDSGDVYSVGVTYTDGCTDYTGPTLVLVHPLPGANAGPDHTICTGDSVLIGTAAVHGRSYSWAPSTGLSNDTIAQPYANPSATVRYTLTVTDTSTGCKNSDSVTITVVPQPVANAGPDQSICVGSSVTIGTPAVAGLTYSWSPSAGLSSTTAAQPQASPAVTTTYVLTASNGSCSNTDTMVVNVFPSPSANAGPDKSVCIGDSTPIGTPAVGGVTYSWSPTTGLSSSTTAQPNASPAATRTYIVTVSSGACSTTDTMVLTVIPLPANAGPDRSVCMGDSVTIGTAAVVGTTYSWSPAAGLSSPTIAQPNASPAATTTYVLTATNATCSSTDTVIVTILPAPGANAGPGRSICAGDSTNIGTPAVGGVTYSWSPTIGLSSSTSAQPNAGPSATTTYTLTTSNGTCNSTSTVVVTVLPLPADAGKAESICMGDSVTIGSPSQPGTTYNWSPSAGLSSTTVAQPSASPTVTTTYTLIASNGTCSGRDSVVVTVSPKPTVNAGTAKAICSGDSATIGMTPVSGGILYNWIPTTGLSSPNASQTKASPANTTLYTLTANNGNCSSTDTVRVTVNPLPAANVGNGKRICDAGSVVLGAPPVAGDIYVWTPSAGLTSSISSQPAANPNTTTTYTLTETDTATGCSMTNTVEVTDGGGDEIYNALSPNGDGINDWWYVPVLDCYPENTVTIVNRWGSEVWMANNYNNTTVRWDGKNMDGTDLPDGTYYYTINYSNTEKRGWVFIKR